jgi:hypothetical protein
MKIEVGWKSVLGFNSHFHKCGKIQKMNPKHSHFGSWNPLGVLDIEDKSANDKYYLNQTFIVSLNFF